LINSEIHLARQTNNTLLRRDAALAAETHARTGCRPPHVMSTIHHTHTHTHTQTQTHTHIRTQEQTCTQRHACRITYTPTPTPLPTHTHARAPAPTRLRLLDGRVHQPLPPSHSVEEELAGRQPVKERRLHKALGVGGLVAAREVGEGAALEAVKAALAAHRLQGAKELGDVVGLPGVGLASRDTWRLYARA
jgi:hypothetical protein